MMAWLPMISTVCIVISAVLMAIGWYFIRHGKRKVHMRYMVAAALFALTFFILYSSRTMLIGNTPFGGPEHVKIYYTIFLIFHIILSTTGAVFGVVTLTLAFRRNYSRHRKVGPWTAIIWFCTAATGVIVYVLLYVLYPHETTTSLFDAIF